jgi:hypothetical protein
MGTMFVGIAHGFLPCTWRVFIRHGQHLTDERGNGPCLPGVVLWSDREHAAGGVVAGDLTRRQRGGVSLKNNWCRFIF